MAGALKKTMVYLGFAEDDRYRDYYEADEYDEVDPTPEPDAAREADVAPLPRRTNVARLVREDPMGALSRITTIPPRTYNEAKNIGENFRDGVPVIMNLTDMSDADAKRLVDFAAGLVFGLHGTIDPDSIGKEKSMGCVRMGSDDIALIYELLTEKVSVIKIEP